MDQASHHERSSGIRICQETYQKQKSRPIKAAWEIGLASLLGFRRLHLPLPAVISSEPFGIAALGKGVLLGIPRNGRLIIVGLVEQMTGD